MLNGVVFDIQRFCNDDGPGIRSTVFLKGCNLKCKWCHNPESLSIKPQLAYNKDKCINCQKCLVCPNDVHSFINGIHNVDLSKCNTCGLCTKECLSDALVIEGKEMSSQEVIDEVLLDKHYYDATKGGVTFSGGEATLQKDFLIECLKKLKENNIHTCLETHGILSQELLEELILYVDLFLIDFKHNENKYHKYFTNASNKSLYNTLNFLKEHNKDVVLRCPIIDGVNNNEEHFKEIARISNFNNILYAQLLPYHSIGEHKYEKLQMDYTFANMPSMSEEEINRYKDVVKSFKGNVI